MPDHPLRPLADLPTVPAAVERVRDACEALRWHRGLRRGGLDVARVEAGVRAAHAGLTADGVAVGLDDVRAVAVGATPAPVPLDGAVGAALHGAVRLEAELRRSVGTPGGGGARAPFAQLLARWHLAADGGPGGGRPRADADPGDLAGLGPALAPDLVPARLHAVGRLVDGATSGPLAGQVPGLLVAAVVQAELLLLRPFRGGNGAVARVAFRYVLAATGVDPVGMAVPEVAWCSSPAAHLAAASRYAVGDVEAWVAHCADTVVPGAEEGARIADAVQRGRLAQADDVPDDAPEAGRTHKNGAP